MEREDNYTSGGALLGRPASSRKERVIKQTRLKEGRRIKAAAPATGHVVRDEVLPVRVKRNLRRTARKHVPTVIRNLGVLPVRVKRTLRRKARKSNDNNISRRLGLTSLGPHSLGSLPRASRPRASQSQAPRSQASRQRPSLPLASPSSAGVEPKFVLASPTFIPPIPEYPNMDLGVRSPASPHHYPTHSQPDPMAELGGLMKGLAIKVVECDYCPNPQYFPESKINEHIQKVHPEEHEKELKWY